MINRKKRPNTLKRVAVGSAIAATAGYLVGLLTAPKSGKQTRSDIKDFTAKNIREAEIDLKKLHTELGKLINESKKRGDKLGSRGKKELDKLVEKAKVSVLKKVPRLFWIISNPVVHTQHPRISRIINIAGFVTVPSSLTG
jgi:gas vesicle protein